VIDRSYSRGRTIERDIIAYVFKIGGGVRRDDKSAHFSAASSAYFSRKRWNTG
jgi:hypothetical protein